MIPLAMMMCLVQVAYAASAFTNEDGDLTNPWMILGVLLALVWPFVLQKRSKHPEPVFWICALATLVFPYDPLLMLMALCSLIARRSDTRRTLRAIVVATPIAVWAQLRDALQPAGTSFWHEVFAKPGTTDTGQTPVMLVEESTIVTTAIVIALLGVGGAILIGLHIRSRARLNEADARTEAARHHAAHLQDDLANQQLADAIAAEAHDTLAHSLSLIALNASALQVEAARLAQTDLHEAGTNVDDMRRRAQTVALKADEIRRQSAGALDEAHAIIDMLRHPQQAWEQLAPSDETALTRESLDALIQDTRRAGTSLNTWIDIHQLGDLDETIGKVAYRAIQESLTNACRHAVGAPVCLEVTVNPQQGVHVHVSNPITGSESHDASAMPAASSNDTAHNARTGAGLPGVAARVRSVGGECRYGSDAQQIFHVDVVLPWHTPDNPATPGMPAGSTATVPV